MFTKTKNNEVLQIIVTQIRPILNGHQRHHDPLNYQKLASFFSYEPKINSQQNQSTNKFYKFERSTLIDFDHIASLIDIDFRNN